MRKGRVEAFSDGVIAIIITIMVLELKIPHEKSGFKDLVPLLPIFLSYILSFIYVGIYWNNHHHLFSLVKSVNGTILWANMHLLFWLSMVPFATAWMGENHFEPAPIALYGFVLLMNGLAYTILALQLVKNHGEESTLAKVIGNDLKGKFSLICYMVAVPIAFLSIWIAGTLYIIVALVWLIPDRRIEKVVQEDHENS
ncbi:MAG: DUF1211 domain-containing protein [Pedobacter sp.]|nr:MAG: DUF1211 domain-containing protein [Pedobacter sp.]